MWSIQVFSKALQLVLYAYLYLENRAEGNIKASILSLKKNKEIEFCLTIDNEELINKLQIAPYMLEIDALLLEMKASLLDFEEKEQKSFWN